MIEHSSLTQEEILRYKRHLSLSEFGESKQIKLKNSKVLIVGAGGLGSPIGLYLAAAGVGTIGVVDFDNVDISNLQRQIAYSVNDLGKPKTECLITGMKGINPLNSYNSHKIKISSENVNELVINYDLIIDGSDNFQTRFLLADSCFLNKRPLLHGAINKFDAQIALFASKNGPCYRCLFREPPSNNKIQSCSLAGVLGPHVGVVGTMMAMEAIKFLTNLGRPAQNRLILFNSLEQTINSIDISHDPSCPLCGINKSINSVQDTAQSCNEKPNNEEITPKDAKDLIEDGAFVIDVRESYEFEIGHLPSAFHLPVGKMNQQSTSNLPSDKPIITYCHHGVRSAYAAKTLKELGFKNVMSLAGGIEAWSIDIDPSIPRY